MPPGEQSPTRPSPHSLSAMQEIGGSSLDAVGRAVAAALAVVSDALNLPQPSAANPSVCTSCMAVDGGR